MMIEITEHTSLDVLLHDPVMKHFDRSFIESCIVEFAQLRAAASEAQAAHVYLDESPVNGDADDTPVELSDRIVLLVRDVIALRATVAEAREVIKIGATVYTGSATHRSAFNTRCREWLAANPAPQPEMPQDEAQ